MRRPGGGRERRMREISRQQQRQGIMSFKWLTVRRQWIILFVVLAADLGCSGLQGVLSPGWGWDLLQGTGGFLELTMALTRILLVISLTFTGAKKGKPPHLELGENDDDHHHDPDDNSDDPNVEMESLLGSLARPLHSLSGPEFEKATKRAIWINRVVVVLLFVVSIASSVTLGVKAAGATIQNHVAGIAFLIILQIVILNVELFLSRRIITVCTSEPPIFVAKLHSHELLAQEVVGYRRCDICHKRIETDPPRCFSCSLCDFDACLPCLKKALKEGRDADGEEESQDLSRLEYLRHSWELIRPRILVVCFALSMVMVKQVASVLAPSYTGKILDAVIRDDPGAFRLSLIIFLSINVVMGAVGGLARVAFSMVGSYLEYDLRTRLMERLVVQDIEFYDVSTTGDLLAKLHSDTRSMLSPVRSAMMSLVGALIGVVGGCIMILQTSWRLSVLAFTILGPLTMITSIYGKWSSAIMAKRFGLGSTITDSARETFQNIRTVRAFAREGKRLDEYERGALERRTIGIKDAWASGGTDAIGKYLEIALQALVLSYGGIAILHGTGNLTIGGLITFQLYWQMLSNSFSTIVDQVVEFTKASGAAERVISLLDRLPLVDQTAGVTLPALGDIELENVSFSYKSRPDNLVLNGINLIIPKGKVVALVGKSGGGKSTIVSLLCGNYKPDSGVIRVGGVDLREINSRWYRSNLGIVQQDTELFNESIERNITFGVDDYAKEELLEASRRANCLEFIERFEEGFSTKVGERGVKISGGQKQRIALARVMIRKPNFLLLDEATSNLDAESEYLVQKSIDEILTQDGQGRPTVVLVAHRLSTVRAADSIAVVDKGRIVEQGTHEELLQRGGIYATLVRRQVSDLSNTLKQDESVDVGESSIDALFEK